MRGLGHALLSPVLCLALAACNTTDALTPKKDIPNSEQTQTTPLQDDLAGDPVQASANRNNDQLSDKPVDQPLTNDRAPQNTLEAQAQALERGEENPALSKSENTTLSANLYKADSDAKPANNIYSTADTKGTIRFLPIIGAPVQAVTPLSKELGNSARANGLKIKPSSDQTAEHVLKGYLSAFSDGKNVTVVYVWDVLDNSGARLHRIQGQDSVPGKGSDAWASVPPELMQQIGNATIAEYMKWLQTQG